MADSRRCPLNPQIDIEQIQLEAQNRWLRPSEVCELLCNHQNFCLTPDPPNKPPSGSLFLFDRKALRYFRKDGHNWRKKKDGKTVQEAHEKLKSGSVDVLHCYYAHGEDNDNFQRRSYWLLDGQLEHIVLVHYREVKEGNRSGIPRLLSTRPGTLNFTGSAQTSLTASSAQENSPALATKLSYASSPSTVNWNGQTASSEFEDVDSGDDFGMSSLTRPTSSSVFHNSSLHQNDKAGNQLGSRGGMSSPYPRGLTDTTVSFGTSINPYHVNQLPTLNLVSDEGRQAGYRTSQEAGLPGLSRKNIGASFSPDTGLWPEHHKSNGKSTSTYEQKILFDLTDDTHVITEEVMDYTVGPYCIVKDGQDGRMSPPTDPRTFIRNFLQENYKEQNVGHACNFPSNNHTGNDMGLPYQVPHEHNFHSSTQFQSNGGSHMNAATNGQPLGHEADDGQYLKNAPENCLYNEHGKLKKLDSFGRWMNNEIGRDCDDSLMASDSCNYWNTLETQNDNKEVSSLSHHMQLNVESLAPSLSQEQLFSILDFSPDWAYSEFETKVLISGMFLGGIENPNNARWCCMFGEVEVPAEVLAVNTLRCQAPAHVPGRVPFYVTSSDRLACSEVREFEYREKPLSVTFSSIKPQEEVHLQIRFAKMLFQGFDRKWLDCTLEKCENCKLKTEIFSRRHADENDWDRIEIASKAKEKHKENPREALMQKLLEDRLYEWLICKAHEEGKGPNILDAEGQGVIHLAAALGYEWAMRPIVAAGISPSFRDAHGWTGLHWAAYFSREETVVALLKLGSAPGAVEDPTAKFPQGRTAADVASSRGHKGIAETAVETVEEQSVIPLDGDQEDQLSFRGSLAAVRKSTQAAARIQAAFRIHSFRQRQLTKCHDDSSEIPSELIAISSLNKPQNLGHFSASLHSAAVRIQQKYRGWKGRKEFIKIRNRILKIQAHVRGHQVRKQYKKVVWSVSIVEKAILRWRRKGAGLRGFRADEAIKHMEPETGKIDEYEFLRVGRKQKVAGVEIALARVQSMVRYREGRDQYMRLLTNFQKLKMDDKGSTSSKTEVFFSRVTRFIHSCTLDMDKDFDAVEMSGQHGTVKNTDSRGINSGWCG
ncbi:hypothetical protein AAC387_Pa10g2129 [Persea americana]